MLAKILSQVDRRAPFATVAAHCDIPCKIYDPITAQLAVLTMIRMVDLLEELPAFESMSSNQQAQFIRLIAEKEQHGRKVKDEIRVIWGDYIKQPQLDSYPELHELVHSIMLLASKAKQHIDRAVTIELLEKVNRFAEIFWLSKGIAVYVATSPYPPTEKLVYPKLES
ncbi:superoxide dismutase, Ni [Shewanella sp. 1CM18E]|uniref:superoxide dismutase, Ni n=1 Tax=Shewanella sp. 1CM18E TaxID=2929169 RepID=UPI0020BFE7E1|nr:superoxide dismutase, Ni [Shewanella sp. 1CM18E]MCK8043709.1 superoxide dismutase, Ni [Shewanella sp. 1CM18E]